MGEELGGHEGFAEVVPLDCLGVGENGEGGFLCRLCVVWDEGFEGVAVLVDKFFQFSRCERLGRCSPI